MLDGKAEGESKIIRLKERTPQALDIFQRDKRVLWDPRLEPEEV